MKGLNKELFCFSFFFKNQFYMKMNIINLTAIFLIFLDYLTKGSNLNFSIYLNKTRQKNTDVVSNK